MNTGAKFSADKKYRYRLWRIWDESAPLINFCMLNPSTADEIENDPTVERCQRRAEMMGYGGLIVTNIFAYRSTDPKELLKVKNPIGTDNDYNIWCAANECKMTICGWGTYGILLHRGQDVLKILKDFDRNVCALKINKNGTPAHPLYIGYDVKPIPFDFKS